VFRAHDGVELGSQAPDEREIRGVRLEHLNARAIVLDTRRVVLVSGARSRLCAF
jgi:hypothetical protein